MKCSWPCSFPGAEPALGWLHVVCAFLDFTRAKRLMGAEDLACCIKPCIRWSSVCVAWARNPKQWARGGLLTPKPAGYIPAKMSTWSFSQAW